MNHKLKQIKRLIIKGDYQFTFQAECELEADGLISILCVISLPNITISNL